MAVLLTREAFKAAVFQRDKGKCVICGYTAIDAHHILERRLFPDGGYYLGNGASVCSACHLLAESTDITVEELRANAGITEAVLPPQLYPDEQYDKWGNPILQNGLRLRGELFDEPGVKKALVRHLHKFTNRVKYPKTWHLPWSKNVSSDDRVLASTEQWIGQQVVITEKMDGENTTMYRDHMHARSLDYESHPSRTRVKALHAEIAYDIPEGWRVCGENLTAVHSIRYDDLMSYFLVYGIWNDQNVCLSWEQTMEWSALLGVYTVPVFYWGDYTEKLCKALCEDLNPARQEGLVVRPADSFHYREFATRVGKFVRANHVQTDEHWMRSSVEYNVIKP